jgi:hypothetical protein
MIPNDMEGAMAETYKCAMCGNVCEKTVSDEDALAECEAIFGDVSEEELAIVCDDCWQIIKPPPLRLPPIFFEMMLSARMEELTREGTEEEIEAFNKELEELLYG